MHSRTAFALITAALVAAAPARADHRRTRAAAAPGADDADVDADAEDTGDDDADRAEPVGIDDLIAATVRRSPDLMRIRSDRQVARDLALAAAAPDEWKLGASFDWKSSTAS